MVRLWTKDKIEEMLKLDRQGFNDQQIADKMGMKMHQVRNKKSAVKPLQQGF